MMDKRVFVKMALTHGMVLVPRKPTGAMVAAGEGITDLVLPSRAFENTTEARRQEIAAAWHTMIETWEQEVAFMYGELTGKKP